MSRKVYVRRFSSRYVRFWVFENIEHTWKCGASEIVCLAGTATFFKKTSNGSSIICPYCKANFACGIEIPSVQQGSGTGTGFTWCSESLRLLSNNVRGHSRKNCRFLQRKNSISFFWLCRKTKPKLLFSNNPCAPHERPLNTDIVTVCCGVTITSDRYMETLWLFFNPT